jgi:hypothetical protein
MSPHPYVADRRVRDLPTCRCGLAWGAAVHFRRATLNR